MAEQPQAEPGGGVEEPVAGTLRHPGQASEGPGAGAVGLPGILVLGGYLLAVAGSVIYALLVLWPTPTPSRTDRAAAAPTDAITTSSQNAIAPNAADADPSGSGVQQASQSGSGAIHDSQSERGGQPGSLRSPDRCPGEPCPVTLFGVQVWIWDEQRLLLIVVLAGMLGSLVHALRSVYWYVGNRTLVRSWLAMYLMMPFSGAMLGLIFYLVVRGGFFSPHSSFDQTSPFGFAAFAALIGMFSQQAVLKLQDVAETLLTKPQPGANATPQESEKPDDDD